MPTAMTLPCPAGSHWMTNPGVPGLAAMTVFLVGEVGDSSVVLILGPRTEFLGWTPDLLGGLSTF